MKSVILFIGLTSLCLGVEKGESLPNLDVPKQFEAEDAEFTPAGYLKRVPIKEDAALNQDDQHKLLLLFRAAAKATKKKYNQDMAIDTGMPLYKILKRYYPEVKQSERESGAMIFLGDIDKILASYQKSLN